MEFYMLIYGDLYFWWHISQSVPPSLLLRLFFPLKFLPCSEFPLRFYFTFQLKKQSCILVNHETSVSNVHCPLPSNHSACMNSYKFPIFSYFSYLSFFFHNDSSALFSWEHVSIFLLLFLQCFILPATILHLVLVW